MKALILVIALIASLKSHSCNNRISPQDLDLVIASGNPMAASTLTYTGQDYLCFDGIDLNVADVIDGGLVESDTKKASREIERQSKQDVLDANEAARKQALKDIRELQPLQDSATLLDVIKRSNKLRAIIKDALKADQ